MKALTAAEMKEVDRLTTERYGIPSLQLMEAAGEQVVQVLREQIPGFEKKRITILCGKGNNGGDGFVVARCLRELDINPLVFLVGLRTEVRGDAKLQLEAFTNRGGVLREISSSGEWESVREVALSSSILIDALIGTGFRGRLEGLPARVIADLEQLSKAHTTLAVDLPSGLPSDGEKAPGPFVRADLTVSFTAPKVGQLISPECAAVGRLFIQPIGSPSGLVEEIGKGRIRWLEPQEFGSLPLHRKIDANKGNFGHALVVAGSLGKSGAAVLAGEAALRAGAGLVTVATPESVHAVVSSFCPDLMTEALECTEAGSVSLRCLEYGRFSRVAQGKSVLGIGPGLSMHPETRQFIQTVVSESTVPLLLDADGLNGFSSEAGLLARRTGSLLAVTPHPGEMSRLVGKSVAEVQSRRLEIAQQAASEWHAFVILKGFHTIIAAPDGSSFVSTTGTPGMAKAGTGDVLIGILTGLTASLGAKDWARTLGFGVYVHGLAGEMAAKQKGEISMLASDLLVCLPDAIRRSIEESNCD